MNLLEMSLKNIGYQGGFVVCDTESTGFAPNDTYSKLLQVSAVKTDLYIQDRMHKVFDQLVNPELPFLKPRKSHPDEKRRSRIPKKITELTGINDDMIAECPGWKTVIPAFYEFIGQRQVMVYHNAPHDVAFLHFFGSKIGYDFRSMPVVDTMAVAKYLWPNEPKGGYKLENLAKKFDISDPHHHNSLNDVEVTIGLLEKEIKELARRHELHSCAWNQTIAMHDADAAFQITDLNPWITADRSKRRLYVKLVRSVDGAHMEHANVYYDFNEKAWGQKKEKTDTSVYDYQSVQNQVQRILRVDVLDWDIVNSAISSMR